MTFLMVSPFIGIIGNLQWFYDNPAKGLCLEQNGQLFQLAYLSDLSRRVPYEMLERSGHMRLIGIASLIRRIKERNALLQEIRSLLRAFDLLKRFVRYPGCQQDRRFLMGTEGRKVPGGKVTPNHSVPSAWVTGVALVSGPSTETLTFPFCLRKSKCQRLEEGQTGA
jgi:hypothetical protein